MRRAMILVNRLSMRGFADARSAPIHRPFRPDRGSGGDGHRRPGHHHDDRRGHHPDGHHGPDRPGHRHAEPGERRRLRGQRPRLLHRDDDRAVPAELRHRAGALHRAVLAVSVPGLGRAVRGEMERLGRQRCRPAHQRPDRHLQPHPRQPGRGVRLLPGRHRRQPGEAQPGPAQRRPEGRHRVRVDRQPEPAQWRALRAARAAGDRADPGRDLRPTDADRHRDPDHRYRLPVRRRGRLPDVSDQPARRPQRAGRLRLHPRHLPGAQCQKRPR